MGEELFCAAYARYTVLLSALAKKYGIPEDEREDIVQETFLAFYTRYSFEWEEYKVKALLCRILKNRCIDFFRQKKVNPISYWTPEQLQMQSESGSCLTEKDSLTLILEKQRICEVKKVIDSMKTDWAEVVRLHIFQDLPMEEVCEILGTTNGACRTRLNRGRKYIREMMKKEEQG